MTIFNFFFKTNFSTHKLTYHLITYAMCYDLVIWFVFLTPKTKSKRFYIYDQIVQIVHLFMKLLIWYCNLFVLIRRLIFIFIFLGAVGGWHLCDSYRLYMPYRYGLFKSATLPVHCVKENSAGGLFVPKGKGKRSKKKLIFSFFIAPFLKTV